MVRIQLFVVDFFEAFNIFVGFYEVNEAISIWFKIDDMFPKPSDFFSFHIFLWFDE